MSARSNQLKNLVNMAKFRQIQHKKWPKIGTCTMTSKFPKKPEIFMFLFSRNLFLANLMCLTDTITCGSDKYSFWLSTYYHDLQDLDDAITYSHPVFVREYDTTKCFVADYDGFVTEVDCKNNTADMVDCPLGEMTYSFCHTLWYALRYLRLYVRCSKR